MDLRHVTVHGHRLGYRMAGSGPVVVLAHGMAGCSSTWQRVLPTLALHCTVIAPDLLGHGASVGARGEYSVAGHANLLRDILAALGIEHATLVGQSFGGGVVMQLAYQCPELCERLVLVSSGGLGREVGLVLRGLSIPGAEYVLPLVCSPTLRDAGDRVAGWLWGMGVRAAPAVEEMWRSYGSLTDPAARRSFFRTLRSVITPNGQRVSANDRLYLATHVPTLIVWGGRDHIIPIEHGRAAHEAIAGSRFVVFDNCGHFPHCEAPDRFADMLLEFLRDTEPARLTPHHRRELLARHAAEALEGQGGSP